MRVLVFGGTGFVGRPIVESALARGHDVTLVTRGLSDASAFPGAARITGERTDPAVLAKVAAESFDLVFDTSGYLPREIRAAAAALARGRVHYAFVSSISVVADFTGPRDESVALAAALDDDGELTVERYGGLKVACENAARAAFGDRTLVVRPGRILGPHDSDPRFPWLARRIAEGGDVLAPGTPDDPVQFIDVRDLGGWTLAAAERGVTGTFNAVCPPLRAGDLYEAIRAVTGSDARFVWVSEEVLVAHGVKPFSEAPFWLPRAFHPGARTDASRAMREGLAFRPMEETERDAWAWIQTGWDAAASVRAQKKLHIPAGLSPERERAILAAMR
jgi:nucleoside-diphosphate-sugar epimerase